MGNPETRVPNELLGAMVASVVDLEKLQQKDEDVEDLKACFDCSVVLERLEKATNN